MGKGKKHKWPSSGSAAQPADGAPNDSAPKWRSSGSAEQPAHPSADVWNEKSKLYASVGYLSFPEGATIRQVTDALRESKESDLSVIHIVFAREDDMIHMWTQIDEEIYRASSVAQPAFQCRTQGNLLSVFSEKMGTLVSDATEQRVDWCRQWCHS